jgi:hypothetical protein
MTESRASLNKADKMTSASQTDVFNVLNFALRDDEALDTALADVMQTTSALYVASCHTRAQRAVFSQPKAYAEKLQNDHQAAIAFKRAKSMVGRSCPTQTSTLVI